MTEKSNKLPNSPKTPIDLIYPYFRENRRIILIGLFCLSLVDILQLLIPRVIKSAVDGLTAMKTDPGILLHDALAIVAIAGLITVLRYVWRRCLIGVSRKVEEGLRNQLFQHLQTLSAGFFQQTKTGDIMAHATNDLQHIRMAIGMGMVALTDGILLGIAAIGFMAYINIRLTLLVMIPMPMIVFGARMFSRKMHRRYRQVQGSFAGLTEAVRENFSGIRLIQAYGMEPASTARIERMSKDYIRQNLRLIRVTGAFFPMMVLFSHVSMAILLLVGGRQTILRIISPGDFVAFVSYLGLLTWPMMAMGWVTNLIQRGRASLERVHRILSTPPDIRESENSRRRNAFETEIVYENVHFAYPGDLPTATREEALKGVSMTIRRGEIVGVVGPPGSGKSTLVRLLSRMYDVSGGRIRIDGIDLHHIHLEDLRAMISVMPQEPFLFSGTVRDNMTFGDPQITESIVRDTARQAALEEQIDRLPAGFDTRIGEKGVILSGGQRQRLALARALLRDAPILVLDDPVSQVDTETAENIIHTIRTMGRRKTIIIVSHRIAALRFADNIFSLDAGRIVESGSHETLMDANGYYARICRLQEVEEKLHAT